MPFIKCKIVTLGLLSGLKKTIFAKNSKALPGAMLPTQIPENIDFKAVEYDIGSI
jgi:hypothetical protein